MKKWIGFFAFLAALLLLTLSVLSYSCSPSRFFTGFNKGAKAYILVTENKELFLKVLEDAQEVQRTFGLYQAHKTLFTEKALKDELDDLYDSTLKFREFLKDLDKIYRE